MSYLIDTSALHVLARDPSDRLGWKQAIAAGLVAMCDITELEYLYSATSSAHRATLLELLRRSFPWVPVPTDALPRAREVQETLTEHGEHRSAGAADLLVAATAELAELTLLHCDRDFEAIAQHTLQPTAMLRR